MLLEQCKLLVTLLEDDMLTSRLDPDEQNEWFENIDPDDLMDEEEAIRIAEFNFECLVYNEPERQIAWRR